MFGAAGVPIQLQGAQQKCMAAQIASKKAGGPFNPSLCFPTTVPYSTTPTAPAPSGGMPTIVWVGLGVAAVGGLAYYMMKRRS